MHAVKVDMSKFTDDIDIVTDNDNDLQNVLQITKGIVKNVYNTKIDKIKIKVLVCDRKEEHF